MKRLMNGVVAAAIAATPLAVMGAQNYTEALNLSTKFFGAQRCGNTQSWIHEACHGHDASISSDGKTVDLEGGWHDCGDHVKFGQTNGYAAALMLHAYLNYESSFQDNYSQALSSGGSNQIPDVLDEVKVYTDYALKTLVDGRLYFQVGNPGDQAATDDHFSGAEPVWQTNNEQSGNREAHYVTEGASNIAGINAAVLSMMSVAYREFDSNYADKCLEKARAMLDFGDIKHESQNSVDRNGYSSSSSTYVDNTWADEMTFGAMELYRATGEQSFIDRAGNYMANVSQFFLPTAWVLDYPNVTPLAVYDYLTLYDSDNTTHAENLKKEVDNYLSNQKAANKLMIMDSDGKAWGSSKYASAAAYMSLLYYNMKGESKYITFAKDNIDFLLGDHDGTYGGSGFSFLAGYGSNYPNGQIHHRAAAGLQMTKWDGLWETWNSSGYQNEKFCEGALVGGPADNVADESINLYYEDSRADFYTNEVCIYYNAPFVAAAGAMIQLKNGNINNKPTDIKLMITSISSGQEAGKNVSTITTVDRNLNDNHTYSVVSGGDNFEIEGNQLKTKVALEIGNYNVTIKSDDGNGGTLEKTFEISVAKVDLKNNVLYELGWYAYENDTVSTIEPGKEYADVTADGVVKVKFNIAKKDTAAKFYPGGALTFTPLKLKNDSLSSADDAQEISFENISYAIIEYSTDNDFKIILPMTDASGNTTTKYDDYSKNLKNTNGVLVTDTIRFDEDNFAQGAWGTERPLDRAKVKNLKIEPLFDNASGTIEIQTVVFDGINFKPTAIGDVMVKSSGKNISVRSFSNKNISLSVPKAGNYSVKLYSLQGRQLYSSTANLPAGLSDLPWEGAGMASGMVLLDISGNNFRSVNKMMMK